MPRKVGAPMKKVIILSIFILTSILLIPASAHASEITSIDVEVELQPDGSAHITEIWTTSDVQEGTQLSRTMSLPDTMHVHSLTASDINNPNFEIVADWSDYTTFEERANRAALTTTTDGYEIWWGLTSYGDNIYIITYIIDGLVEEFSNASGLYHYFVPTGISPTPGNVSLNLSVSHFDITEENAAFELLGMRGELNINANGAVTVQSTGRFRNNDGLRLLASFDQELFSPPVVHPHALDFADFLPTSGWVVLAWIGVLLTGTFTLIATFIKAFSRTKLTDGTKIRYPKKRDIQVQYTPPMNLSLAGLNYLANTPRSSVHIASSAAAWGIFSAYLQKWAGEGIVEIKEAGKHSNIYFNESIENLETIEKLLYNHLAKYTDQNNMLSSSEKKKWEEIGKFIHGQFQETVHQIGENELISLGILGIDSKGKTRYTPTGYHTLTHFWGLSKFLTDGDTDAFTDHLQQDHLIIATLLGLEKPLKKYYNTVGTNMDNDMSSFFLIMWMTGSFSTQANAHYQSSVSVDSGGFSAGGASGGGGGGIS